MNEMTKEEINAVSGGWAFAQVSSSVTVNGETKTKTVTATGTNSAHASVSLGMGDGDFSMPENTTSIEAPTFNFSEFMAGLDF